MQYKKVVYGETIIEFHNSWLGEETVIANGRTVSKKSSVWGTNHYFSVIEDGHPTRYVLTTKVADSMQIQIDLIRNGIPIKENLPLSWGSKPRKLKNKAKKDGIAKLNEYDLAGATESFAEALAVDPADPEIYFHVACVHSIMEEPEEAFEALRNAVKYGLEDKDMILKHDMLAYVRMREAFEAFLESEFTQYNSELLD